MQSKRRILRWATIFGSLCWLVQTNIAAAIDLRSEVGEKTIVRSVSFVLEEQPPITESQSATANSVSAESDGTATGAVQFAGHQQHLVSPVQQPMPHPVVGQPILSHEMHGYDMHASGPCQTGFCPPVCIAPYWASFDFLVWWRREREFPALVTTEPNGGILPGATVLFGGEMNESPQPGGRFDAGFWLDPCKCWGVGVGYFAVGDESLSYAADSNQFNFLARPYFDAEPVTPGEDSIVVANLPGVPGRISIQGNSEVYGGDVYFRRVLNRNACMQLDLLVGYQTARINEDLRINSVADDTPSLTITDEFETENEYHAAFFGFDGVFRRGCFSLEMLMRFGFGNMNQRVGIHGMSTGSSPDSGLLAQSATNAGVHEQDDFAFMEDVGFKLAYHPMNRMKVSLGYSLMFWSSVARPERHIDRRVDSRLFAPAGVPIDPAATNPAFSFDPTHFLIHGINAGVEFTY